MLGILKAGAAYVPLDPSSRGRLELMLRKSGARFISAATNLNASPGPSGCTSIPVSRPPPGRPFRTGGSSGDAAYVMFTSGSTGVPKGVRVLHRGISRLVINTNYSVHSSGHRRPCLEYLIRRIDV